MALTLIFTTTPPKSQGVQYASSSFGDDSNNGVTPMTPKATLAAAYADLPATGGTVFAAADRYDVGSGLVLTRGKNIDLIGTITPPGHIVSTDTAPLALNRATIFTSAAASSLVSFTGGTAATPVWGSLFRNLIFEFSDPATLIGIDAPSVRFLEVDHCYGFADFTTIPPAATAAQLIWARGENAYGGGSSESSWGRYTYNKVNAMALGTWGNPTGTKLSNNQNIIEGNVGFGLSATATDLPMISIYGAHRDVIRNNGCEFYDTFLLMDHCFGCAEDGDGGEQTLIWLDLYYVQGSTFRPIGISWSAAGSTTPNVSGALLVRGDVGTQNNIFTLGPTSYAADLHRLYRPTDDGSQPAISLANTDNIVNSPRYSTDLMRRSGTFTSTPGAVATLNIPHGMTNAFTSAETTPAVFNVRPVNAAAAIAPGYYVTVDATNLTLNFSANLTAATSYSWRWSASAR